jgi:hypothetical protein
MLQLHQIQALNVPKRPIAVMDTPNDGPAPERHIQAKLGQVTSLDTQYFRDTEDLLVRSGSSNVDFTAFEVDVAENELGRLLVNDVSRSSAVNKNKDDLDSPFDTEPLKEQSRDYCIVAQDDGQGAEVEEEIKTEESH